MRAEEMAERAVGPASGLVVAALPLLALVVVFTLMAAPVVTSPFGDSHDGRNAAMWATGAKALRSDGVTESRLGGRHGTSMAYANHPPLIYLEVAAVETILGENRWATRAPAWVGSIAAIGLLLAILRQIGVRAHVASVTVAVVLSSAMFLVYGTMLDTPVIAFPLALAYVLAVLRHPGGHWSIAVMAGLACLAAWQSFFLVAVVSAAVAARDRSLRAPVAVWSLPALVVAGVAVVGWQLWVLGSPQAIIEVFTSRSGLDGAAYDGRASVRGMVVRQSRWFRELVSPFALIVAVVGLSKVRSSPSAWLVAATGAGVVGYSLLMSGGAYFHDYWQYWVLLPVALLVAIALERLDVRPALLTGVGVVGVAVGAMFAHTSDARASHTRGLAAVDVITVDEFREQDVLLVGALSEPLRWVSYEAGRDPEDVSTDPTATGVRLEVDWRLDERYPGHLRRVESWPYVLLEDPPG